MHAPSHSKGKGKGGRGHKMEDDEDAELLRDEEDGGERAGHRLQVLPSLRSHLNPSLTPALSSSHAPPLHPVAPTTTTTSCQQP